MATKSKRNQRTGRESGQGRVYPKPPLFSLNSRGGRGGGRASGGDSVGDEIAATTNVVPNINQILGRDPYYQLARGRSLAQGIATRAERDEAARRAVIDFGYTPAGLPDWMKDVLDPTTVELANKNTASGMSIWARLKDAANIQRRDLVNVLGARGTFNSGETGYGMQRTQLAADQGRYDATKSVLDYLAGVQSAFAQSERERLAQEEAARQKTIENWDGSMSAVGPGLQSGGKPIIPPFNLGAPPTGGPLLKPKTKKKTGGTAKVM